MWPAEALKEWREFYLLVGTAGATLLALLFVAVSLGAGYLTEKRQASTRTFMSPVVIHFSTVFLASAIALAPLHGVIAFAVPVASLALIGLAVSSAITIKLFQTRMTEYWQDHCAYGLFPLFGYLALLIAAATLYREREFSLDLMGAALLALTVINIRNAWDLTLTMVQRNKR
ncbi:MAG: hypothetical protein AB7F37_19615 [Variibacter sp.]